MLEDRADIMAALGKATSLEMEQVFLSAVLHDNTVIGKTAYLRPEDFADPTHSEIWRIALETHHQGGTVSPVTLKARADCGGAAYLAELATCYVGVMGAPGYAEGIRDMAHRRQLVLLADQLAEAAIDFNISADEIVSGTVGDLQKLAGEGVKQAVTKREVAESIARGLNEELPCYSTGLATLDGVMGGGLFAGKLYTTAARKKVGKTVLLGTVSHNLNHAGVKHLFIALEMSPAEIEQRNAARELGINSIKFLKRDDPGLMMRVADYAATLDDNTVYEHAPGASFDQLRSMVSRAIAKHGIKGFILDYVQLVRGKSPKDTEEYHLRNVSQWLADVARREGLFVLTAAQVNQDGNTRGGEGLKLASDMYFTLHREKDKQGAWLEMEETRYTLYANVGSKTAPGLWLNKHGPFFEEAAHHLAAAE